MLITSWPAGSAGCGAALPSEIPRESQFCSSAQGKPRFRRVHGDESWCHPAAEALPGQHALARNLQCHPHQGVSGQRGDGIQVGASEVVVHKQQEGSRFLKRGQAALRPSSRLSERPPYSHSRARRSRTARISVAFTARHAALTAVLPPLLVPLRAPAGRGRCLRSRWGNRADQSHPAAARARCGSPGRNRLRCRTGAHSKGQTTAPAGSVHGRADAQSPVLAYCRLTGLGVANFTRNVSAASPAEGRPLRS